MTEPLDLKGNYPRSDYGYKLGGDGSTVVNGKKQIDCSHLVNLLLKGAGYDIPYEDTRVMNNSSYYTTVLPQDVKKGDIALWIDALPNQGGGRLFHTGIVEEFDPATNAGKIFGAQSSTGPDTAVFGPRPPSYYWPVPTKFIRAKETFRTAGDTVALVATPTPVGPVAMMDFQYPIRKADGKQFEDAECIYTALEAETSGHYLLGNNKFWHGGIHITDKSAPQCVLNEPVRCVADGEVVAYRLNDDYLESTFGDNEKKLKYSNAFCLVRHEYKSPPNPEDGENKGKQNTLNFYSLYMHLLPYKRYPLSESEKPTPKITMRVNDFRAYDVFPEVSGTPSPGKLSTGTKLEVLEQKDVGNVTYAKGRILCGGVRNGASNVRGMGAEVWFAYLKDGAPYQNLEAKTIWKADKIIERLRPNYWQGKVKATVVNKLDLYGNPLVPQNGQPAGSRIGTMQLIPGSVVEFDSKDVLNLTINGVTRRMAKCTKVSGDLAGAGTVPSSFWACVENQRDYRILDWTSLTPASFDVVEMASIGIKAGDPIGYLGLVENLTGEDGGVTSKYQVHVEIFTAETGVKDFLRNVAGLKSGKQYLHLAAGTGLKKKGITTDITELKNQHAIELNKVSVVSGDTEDWYEVSVIENGQPVTGLVEKVAAEIVTQHDWEKLGFQIVEERNAAADGFLDPEETPQFFKDLFARIDTNHDGQVNSDELADALKSPETRDQWAKLIAHHPTEWKDKADAPRWSRLDQLLESSPKTLKHERERINTYVFWEELAGKAVTNSDVIWHFHPIEMLRNLMVESDCINVEKFVVMYTEQHISFKAGSPKLTERSRSNLQKVVENINKYIKATKEIYTIYELSYMLATARHEAYHFTTREYFSVNPEIDSASYFDKYDPVLASSVELRKIAIGNGNTVQGDGFKYRGRGLVHLTWKNNYQKAKDFFDIDFVNYPDEAASFENSVPVMIWGMKEGVFTGRRLSSYINNETKDYEGARKVINGSDQKVLIASYAKKFEDILKATSIAPEVK